MQNYALGKLLLAMIISYWHNNLVNQVCKKLSIYHSNYEVAFSRGGFYRKDSIVCSTTQIVRGLLNRGEEAVQNVAGDA